MSHSARTILVVEDAPSEASYCQRLLQCGKEQSYQVLAERYDALPSMLCQLPQLDAVIWASSASAEQAIELLSQPSRGDRRPPVIAIGSDDANSVLQAMKAGAVDYLVRDRVTAASLCQAVDQAIAAYQRRRQNAAFLAAIALDLSCLSSADEIVQTIGAKVGEYFQVSNCLVIQIDEAQDCATVAHSWHTAETPEIFGTYRLSEFSTQEFRQALRAGETVIVRDTHSDPRTDTDGHEALGIGAFITVPFHRNGQWKYALTFSSSTAYNWRDDQIELIQEVANRLSPCLEHARAQAALRESEENYRRLFTSIDEGFCIIEVLYDAEGMPVDHRILKANPAYERQSGIYNPEGKAISELVPGIEPYWTDLYAQVIRTGTSVRVERRSERLNRWFNVLVCRVGDIDRNQVAVVFSDISDRKRAEAERQQAKAAIAADLEATRLLHNLSARLIPEGDMQVLYDEIMAAAITLMTSDAGTVQIWDESTQHLLLLAVQGFEPTTTDHFRQLNASSNTSCGIAIRTNKRCFVDYDLSQTDDPDGSVRLHIDAGYRSAQSTPLISRSGRPIGVVSTHWRRRHRPSDRELEFLDLLARQAADLIDQQQAKISIQKSEERLQQAMAIGTVGITFFTDRTITAANKAFLRMSGYSRVDLEADYIRWDKMTPPKHMPRSLQAMAELKSTGCTTPYEKEYIRKDGSRWWGLFAAKRIGDDEAVEFIIDISDRKRFEQDVNRRAQELNKLNRVLEALTADLSHRNQELQQFAYVVSHDLKAPLRGIRNLSDWLQEDLGDALPAENQEQLQLMVQRVDRMEALINDLLDYSRAGRIQRPVEQVNLDQVLCEIIAVAMPPPGIRTYVPKPLPVFRARRLNLEQVFSNLIDNAVKYGCPGQQGQVTIAAQETADTYKFSVADDGPGIAPAHHDKIFGIFETLQPVDASSTGIGLAITKKLVEAEGGHIWLESEVGAGTTIYFTWPKCPPADA